MRRTGTGGEHVGAVLRRIPRRLSLRVHCRYDATTAAAIAHRHHTRLTSSPRLPFITADDCVGPGADAYRASVDLYGEDAAGRPAAVVTPPDAAGCVAEQVCMAGRCAARPPAPHHPSPPSPPIPICIRCAWGTRMGSSRRRPTAAMRTNHSAPVCDAPGVCYDVTTPARCYVPSLNQTECAGCAEGCGGRHPACGTGCPLEWDVESRDPTSRTPHSHIPSHGTQVLVP